MADNLNSLPQLIAQSTAITPEQWQVASEDQRKVLQRIEMQRSRLKARAVARAQAKAVHSHEVANLQGVPAGAPLPERLMAFARLHPVAVAAAGAAALMIGPRKLMRVGSIMLPWVMRLLQKR